jgi:hypothetical protein
MQKFKLFGELNQGDIFSFMIYFGNNASGLTEKKFKKIEKNKAVLTDTNTVYNFSYNDTVKIQ